MESFSIRVDCPDTGQLLDALWPKLDEYCVYEVLEYASGKVMTISFERFLTGTDSSLLALITMDFTPAGQCQIDIISGGGGRNGDILISRYGPEKSVVTHVIQFFVDICKAKGWNIREDESESAE